MATTIPPKTYLLTQTGGYAGCKTLTSLGFAPTKIKVKTKATAKPAHAGDATIERVNLPDDLVEFLKTPLSEVKYIIYIVPPPRSGAITPKIYTDVKDLVSVEPKYRLDVDLSIDVDSQVDVSVWSEKSKYGVEMVHVERS